MKAYYRDSFTSVSSWTKDTNSILDHFDSLYDLGMQMTGANYDLTMLTEQGLLDAMITHTLENIHTLVLFDLHSTLGQVLVEYLEIKGRNWPVSAVQLDTKLLFAPSEADWFGELVGDNGDTYNFEKYAKSMGVEVIY